MQSYIGSILPMAFNFAPRGWASCEGQIMSIAQNQALFSLLGTNYGGDGVTTFALPDLRGRMVVGQGTGPGLPGYVVGQKAGVNDVSLLLSQLPAHTHNIVAKANGLSSNSNDPNGNYFGGGTVTSYDTTQDNSSVLNAQCITASTVGNNLPVDITNPYVAMYYCINTVGFYPSRN